MKMKKRYPRCPACNHPVIHWNFEKPETAASVAARQQSAEEIEEERAAAAERQRAREEEEERNKEFNDTARMQPDALDDYAVDFKNAVNRELPDSVFKACIFDADSVLKGGSPCGNAIHREIAQSDLAAALGAALRRFELDLEACRLKRIVIRRAPANGYAIDGWSLIVLRNFGTMPSGSCTSGKESSLLSSDLKKAFAAAKPAALAVSASVVASTPAPAPVAAPLARPTPTPAAPAAAAAKSVAAPAPAAVAAVPRSSTGPTQPRTLVTSDAADAVAFLTGLAYDQDVELLDCSESTAFDIVSVLGQSVLANGAQGFEHITALNLGDCKLGKAGGEALAALITPTRSLKKLSVGNNDIGDAGFKPLVKAIEQTGTIVTFSYMGNDITDKKLIENLDKALKKNAEKAAKAAGIKPTAAEAGVPKNKAPLIQAKRAGGPAVVARLEGKPGAASSFKPAAASLPTGPSTGSTAAAAAAPVAAAPVAAAPVAAAPVAAKPTPTPAPAARAAPTPAPAPVAAPAAAEGGGGTPTYGTGWTLRERKGIKDVQSELDDAIKDLQEKLGTQWTIVINWDAFADQTKNKGKDRPAGPNIITKLVGGFQQYDIPKFDDDIVDALNTLCKTTTVTFSMKKFSGNRVQVKASASGVQIDWNEDWWGYNYADMFVANWVLNNC